MAKELLGSLELNRIYQRDCIEGMRMLPNKSVDLIVIDPPYNIGKDKRWDKWKTVEDYVNWMTLIFKECERVLKETGSFYWFHNDFEQIVDLQKSIKDSTEFVFKQFIVWNKRFEGASNKGFLDGFIEPEGLRNYQKMAEYVLFYTLQDESLDLIYGNSTLFKPIREYLKSEKKASGLTNKDLSLIFSDYTGKIEGCRDRSVIEHYFSNKQWCLPTEELYKNVLQITGYFQKPYNELRQEYEVLRQEYESLRYTYNNQKTHHSVWNYEVAPKLGHVTPKPLEFIENIIRHSSNERDVVLDCFMGSGTTAVAAVRTGRKFIGFEREPEYIEIANKRLDNETEAN